MENIDPKKTAIMVMHSQNAIVKPGNFNYSGAPAQVQKYNVLDKIKKALEVGLVVWVVVLVILGLIIGFNKLKGSDEEDEEKGDDQTYY